MKEENYISLILKKLNKSISKKENSILENWVSLEKENEKLFNSTLSELENSNLYKSSFKANKELAWQKIQNKISGNSNSNTKSKTVSFNYKRTIKIAATVIILFSVSYLLKDSIFNDNFTEIHTSSNETKGIVLPDGSEVFLSENSSIEFATFFEKRNIKLKGEAFFEVTKDTEHPFIITAGETETQVLGTSFNIEVNKGNVEVALLTGKVKFSNLKNNSLILNPGEIGLYNKGTTEFSKRNTKIEHKKYWKTKKLEFENINISDVILSLENFYNVEILFTENTNCTFTGKFDNHKIEEALEILSYSLNTNYTQTKGKYSIGELNCK